MSQQVTGFTLPLPIPRHLKPTVLLTFLLLCCCALPSLHAGIHAAPFPGDTLIEAQICQGQSYIFADDLLTESGEYMATFTASDGTDSVVTLVLDVLPQSFSEQSVTICQGETYPFFGVDLGVSGDYDAVLPAANGCDSTVLLHLKVLPPKNTILNVGICAGTNYIFQGDTLDESGVYSVVLTAASGCDSVVTLNLQAVEFFDIKLNVSICPGDSYIFGNDTLSAEGTYVDSLVAIGGCDSTVTLNLSYYPVSVNTHEVAICEGANYFFEGLEFTDPGTYTVAYTDIHGCDSLEVLVLSLVTFYDVQTEASICEGDAYILGSQILTEAGEYTETFTAVGGCDSIVTLNLHILPLSSGNDGATICAGESYEYQGETLTDEGVYQFTLSGANGCDSIVVFRLFVLPAIETVLDVTICEGETYEFNGALYGTSGTYDAVFTAENGCDSTVTLHLLILPPQYDVVYATICAGESYNYDGVELTEAGAYDFILLGLYGCDSIVTVVLTVNQQRIVELSVDICEGDSYEFDGSLLTQAGVYEATYTGPNGCDSTIILDLGILPLQETEVEATICANSTYSFDGEELSDPGEYTGVFTSVNGCDSTVILHLNVLPVFTTTLEETICEGETFNYFGLALSDAGTYEFTFEAENGCDSTVSIVLTVLEAPHTHIEATICSGETYDYNGEPLSETGDYSFEYQAENGCDSTVTVHLDVLPVASSSLSLILCQGDSYTFGGEVITTAGVYTNTYTGANGCDSTATLIIDFVNSYTSSLEAAICPGGSYIFGNDTLVDAGVYTQVLTAAGGCDSTIILQISFLPTSSSTTAVSICEGESYVFNDEAYSAPGSYSVTLTGANGCDSIATLQLSVLPVSGSSIAVSICANESYPFNGQLLTTAGVYTSTLQNANGCDSTVTLTLSILPVSSSEVSASICAGESFAFNGQEYSQSGVYIAQLTGANGCDSTAVLVLDVLPWAQGGFAVTSCNGEPFEYLGVTYTQSGTYQVIFENAAQNGCDSVVTFFVTIFPAIPPTQASADICQGDSYVFDGESLTQSGVYTAELSSSVGCDSVVVLTLTVHPTVFTSINASFCEGGSYAYNGQVLTDPGTYTFDLQTAYGCDSIVTLTLAEITVNTNISVQSNVLTAAATNANYQWINCDTNQPIPGANNNSYAATASGNYAVVVTQNGCTATSTCIFVEVVGVTEPEFLANWQVQPNPATDMARIVFQQPVETAVWLDIQDVAGRVLYRERIAAGTETVQLPLGEYPAGMLLLRLSTAEFVSTRKLVKSGG